MICIVCRTNAPPLCQIGDCKNDAAIHLHSKKGDVWVCTVHQEIVYGSEKKNG